MFNKKNVLKGAAEIKAELKNQTTTTDNKYKTKPDTCKRTLNTIKY